VVAVEPENRSNIINGSNASKKANGKNSKSNGK
jgi:hypothetical protein